MTGIVTAAWISLMSWGSDMRATPPANPHQIQFKGKDNNNPQKERERERERIEVSTWKSDKNETASQLPSFLMSAGTLSRAMTAQAPASSAILACSAFTTSMMTPPLKKKKKKERKKKRSRNEKIREQKEVENEKEP